MATIKLQQGQTYWVGEGAKKVFFNFKNMVPGVATLHPNVIPINVDAYEMEQLEEEVITLNASSYIVDTSNNQSNEIIGGRPRKARRK